MCVCVCVNNDKMIKDSEPFRALGLGVGRDEINSHKNIMCFISMQSSLHTVKVLVCACGLSPADGA